MGEKLWALLLLVTSPALIFADMLLAAVRSLHAVPDFYRSIWVSLTTTWKE